MRSLAHPHRSPPPSSLAHAAGMEMSEPATDLAVACAIASSHLEQPIPRDAALIGEVGLGGELRPVGNIERRIAEAAKASMLAACEGVMASNRASPPQLCSVLKPARLSIRHASPVCSPPAAPAAGLQDLHHPCLLQRPRLCSPQECSHCGVPHGGGSVPGGAGRRRRWRQEHRRRQK